MRASDYQLRRLPQRDALIQPSGLQGSSRRRPGSHPAQAGFSSGLAAYKFLRPLRVPQGTRAYQHEGGHPGFSPSPSLTGSATVNRGHAATAVTICLAFFGGRPRRFGATQAGKGTW